MAGELGARLTVLHAPTAAQSPQGTGLEQRIRAEIAEMAQKTGARAEVLLEAGDPPKVVCAAAERLHADLLVIGRGSAGGVFGRLRTNAYAIIRQSPCPVVSV